MDNKMILGTLAGLGTGAAAMYFLDPDRGNRRRAIVADKVARSARKVPRAIRVTKEDISNRAYGAFAETKTRLFSDDASDGVIEARVRSKMGRVVSHPHAIKVACENGDVTLSGPIRADEVKRLIKCASSVPGVRSVTNDLEQHDSPEGVSALQGGTRREARSEFLQEHWSPAARLAAGTAGTAALAYGLLKRDALSISVGTLGAALIARSATNLELQRLLGYGGGRRAVDIQKTITVDAPIDVVFALWSNFENFPKFMSNVVEVDLNGPGESHWKVKGPAGSIVEWDAEITVAEADRTIAWKSRPGSVIENAGIVKFSEVSDGTTEVNIRLSYNPPAGAVGHGVATIFGADPKTQMDEDLMRMKNYLETGQLPHDAASSRSFGSVH
jgi:uncharacterized membrane protein